MAVRRFRTDSEAFAAGLSPVLHRDAAVQLPDGTWVALSELLAELAEAVKALEARVLVCGCEGVGHVNLACPVHGYPATRRRFPRW